MPITQVKLSPDFALVFRALPGLYLLLSPELKVLDATERYARTSNFDLEGTIGKHIMDTFPENPEKSDEPAKTDLTASLSYVLAQKQPHTMPQVRYDVPLAGGGFERRYWTTTHTPILNANGELVYILQETRDVTETVLQEQLNEENKERLTLLTETLNAVTWEYQVAQDKLNWGEKLQQVFGYSPKDMARGRESWSSRVHPADYEAVQQNLEQAVSSGGNTWTSEYRFQKADGAYAYVQDQGVILYDEKCRIERLFGAMIDLTESKQSEESLRESKARFWHILERLPHMAWMADAKGRLIYFNENWYDYTGLPQGQVQGWINAIHPEDSAHVLTAWAESYTHGYMFEHEYRIRNQADGTYRWFLDRGVPMFDEQGKVEAWIGTFTDIEEQRSALAQVQLKDQQLENILRLSPAHLCLLMGPDYVCRYVTPGIYKMYGSRQYLGRPAREIWPDMPQPEFMLSLDQVYQEQSPVTIKEVCIPFSRHFGDPQQEAYFDLQLQPIINSDQQIEGILLSALEVTELVQCKQKAQNAGAAGEHTG
ncbi:PAS domain-containing protein [Pontibacter litorisediminis]|uniref:PAS domain-containing protein n=1 Tax=Pontibacter litorisediminis TaxID=1846260 RepID=UPI0023EC8E9D|nr:PAS domain-containing protein [Pontibacter litorisediminis]